MRNNNIIKPIGLKGNESIERMKSLMGVAPVNEGISRSEVVLTKLGPDGKVYGIVKENHKYFIKTSDKKNNLVTEDFQYIGGLKNKMLESYDSYSNATKHLNLKFLSISEAIGKTVTIDVLKNDNLLSEGDLPHNPENYKDQPGYVGVTDGDYSEESIEETEGTCGVVRGKGHDTHIMENDDELTETEKAIDEMLNPIEESEEEPIAENFLINNRLKISEAINLMDDAISEATNERVKTMLETLTEKEKASLLSGLKKKA